MNVRGIGATDCRRVVILSCLLLLAATPWLASYGTQPIQAPEFTHSDEKSWINSAPLSMKNLRGQVVLLDFWTFDCWHCKRSLPWVKSLEKKYQGRPLKVVGVHTPEFPHERDLGRLLDQMKLLNIQHSVMADNDFSYWNAIGNQGWPSFYLIDKAGRIRDSHLGEIHPNEPTAQRIEALIDTLLAE